MGKTKQKNQKKQGAGRGQIVAWIALTTILISWIAGGFLVRPDFSAALSSAMPESEVFESVDDQTWAGWRTQPQKTLQGYVTVKSTPGYGGPVTVAIVSTPEGVVRKVDVVDHKETLSFFKKVIGAGLIDSLVGKLYSHDYILNQDVDNVSGATRTTYAITHSVREGIRQIADKQLHYPLKPDPSLKVRFGAPEMVLVGLYLFGFIARFKKFPLKKSARWASLLVGMAVLGFVYNLPLSISMINQALLGYMPVWQTNLYWFLLLGGLLLFFILDKKNIYCSWFCPFGAVQECLAAIGGAKKGSAGKYRNLLLWNQRFLAWLAIVMALLFRNPGVTSFEVFGTAFSMFGSIFQQALLVLVLFASFVIFRPWCTYLCPLKVVYDVTNSIRSWLGRLRGGFVTLPKLETSYEVKTIKLYKE